MSTFLPANTFGYNAACLLRDGTEELLDLEVHGWADKSRLANTVRFSLIPKEGIDLPVVLVNIPEGAKPVFKSRVFGMVSLTSGEGGPVFRCYAVGWKRGKYEHLLWVLPTGDIEVGPDPLMAGDILTAMKAEPSTP